MSCTSNITVQAYIHAYINDTYTYVHNIYIHTYICMMCTAVYCHYNVREKTDYASIMTAN